MIKEKIKNIIIEIEKEILRINKGIAKAQESEDFFSSKMRDAKEVFGKDTDSWRHLDKWENENGFQWHHRYKLNSYADSDLKNKLQKFLDKLSEILDICNSAINLNKNEHSFSKDQKYEVNKFLIKLFKNASSSIIIVDNYLDENIFDFIDIINNNVIIKFITSDKKLIFKRLFLSKKKERGNMEVKINDESHNRYIVVDGTDIYSIDASINTIGKKDFMIHKVIEEKDKVLDKINKWWKDGENITLRENCFVNNS